MSRVAKSVQSTITAPEISAALKRVLKSEDFKRSPRLSEFLGYIVDMYLKGEADQIKGYTIGLEVFGKPESFDPEQDASVRVDATRLRRALRAYYSAAGKDDPIIISMPSGTYVPLMTRRKDSVQGSPGTDPRKIVLLRSFGKAGNLLLAIALLGAGILIGFGLHFVMTPHETPRGEIASQFEEIFRRPSGPTIGVQQFHVVGEDENSKSVASGFTYQLLTDLTRFKSLRVLGAETIRVFEGYDLNSLEIAVRVGADYMISGNLQSSDGETQIEVRLLDVSTASYIWSYSKKEKIRPDNLFQVQTKIVGEIAARLGQPYGIVQRYEARRLKAAEIQTADSFSCVVNFYDYAANKSAKKHKEVKECLLEAVSKTPDHAELWAFLSWMYGDEIRYGYNFDGDRAATLNAMHKASNTAIDVDPENPRAQQYRASVAMLMEDRVGARMHLKRALALNPNDAEILADAGWAYCLLGNWELGKSLVEKAIWLNPGHPRWYHGILFAYHYRDGNYERARTHALAYYQRGVMFSAAALVAVNGKLGRLADTAALLQGLTRDHPEFIADPKRELAKRGFQPDFIAELLDGISRAGLKLALADQDN